MLLDGGAWPRLLPTNNRDHDQSHSDRLGEQAQLVQLELDPLNR
jgi:hypothetical protein